jgi:autotransporter-associated beta strand protein
MSGSVNWQKRGGSILRLTNVNTFSGGMTIAAGTVEIGNASALGTGTVTMTGGKLSSSSTTGYTLANALTLNGTMTLGDATNNGSLTISGTTNVSGTSTLSIATAVTLSGQLTGSSALSIASIAGVNACALIGTGNTYSGAFSLTSGAARVGNFSGATNQLAAAVSIALSAGTILWHFGTTNTTISTPYTGPSSSEVVVWRDGTLTFSGSALGGFNGPVTLYREGSSGIANSVEFSTNTAFPSSGGFKFLAYTSVAATHTLRYTGSGLVTNTGTVAIVSGTTGSTVTLDHSGTSGATLTLNGNISNTSSSTTTTLTLTGTSTGALTLGGNITDGATATTNISKTGTITATLSGANTNKGTVAVSAGTLSATTNATALGSTSGGAISVTGGATLSLGAAATYTSRSLSIGGTGVSSTVGALVIANAGTSAFQSITLGSTTYIRATNSGSINAPFTPNNNSVIFGASAGSNFVPFASLSNVFSGTGSVTYGSHSLDTGTVNADVRHTYTGNTTLAFGTTSVASAQELPGTGGPLGNKSLTAANTLLMTGGTLSYLDGNVDYSGRFSTAGGQQWRIAAGTATTFATALVGASSLRLFGGSLTLSSASSTFSGGVTLTEGTLYAGAAQSGVSGPLGITGTITFSPAGTGVLGYTAASAAFDYSSRFATTSGQSRRINANGESVTFSTAMGGDNELRLVGSAGTLTLAVANTYTQGTTLSVGTLKCGNAASLGTGGLAQANGTTLHVTATGGKLTIQGAHTNTGTGNRTIRIGA